MAMREDARNVPAVSLPNGARMCGGVRVIGAGGGQAVTLKIEGTAGGQRSSGDDIGGAPAMEF